MPYNYAGKNVILLFFVLQLLLFTCLLFIRYRREGKSADGWLSLLLLLAAMYITPWMLGHAGWYAQDGYREFLFFIPFHQYFLIGPVMFFLTAALTDSEASTHIYGRSYWHFLPAFAYLLYAVIVAIADLLILDEFHFYADGLDKDFKVSYQFIGLCTMILYASWSIRLHQRYKARIFNTLSFADSVTLRWLQNFLTILVAIILLRGVFIVLWPEIGDWGLKWWYYFAFGILSCYLAISGYTYSFKIASLPPNALKGVPTKPDTPSSGSSTGGDLPALHDNIIKLFVEQQLYQDSTLSLSRLAATLDTHPTKISRAINTVSKMNFNDFVNSHRIAAVKLAIQQGESDKKTLIGIAYDHGFNSKSTFLRAFKKFTGQTASQYVQAIARKK